jgi:hypothetical protein
LLHPACPVMFDVFCDFPYRVDMNDDVTMLHMLVGWLYLLL